MSAVSSPYSCNMDIFFPLNDSDILFTQEHMDHPSATSDCEEMAFIYQDAESQAVATPAPISWKRNASEDSLQFPPAKKGCALENPNIPSPPSNHKDMASIRQDADSQTFNTPPPIISWKRNASDDSLQFPPTKKGCVLENPNTPSSPNNDKDMASIRQDADSQTFNTPPPLSRNLAASSNSIEPSLTKSEHILENIETPNLFRGETISLLKSKDPLELPIDLNHFYYGSNRSTHIVVQQLFPKGSGSAALLMLFTDFFKKKSANPIILSQIFWESFQISRNLSGEQIKKLALEADPSFLLKCTRINSKTSPLQKIKNLLNTSGFPVIVSITTKELGSSWIVVDKVTPDGFTIIRDPVTGKAYRITNSEMFRLLGQGEQTCLYIKNMRDHSENNRPYVRNGKAYVWKSF